MLVLRMLVLLVLVLLLLLVRLSFCTSNLCRCFGAPARRVFPDHLITSHSSSFFALSVFYNPKGPGTRRWILRCDPDPVLDRRLSSTAPMAKWDDPMSEREVRLRRRRGSGDLVMARPPTVGAGLNELDNLIDNLQAAQEKQSPQQQVRDALGVGIMTVLTAALALFIGLVGMRPTTCEDTCAAAATRPPPAPPPPSPPPLSRPPPSLPPPSLTALALAVRVQRALHLHARTRTRGVTCGASLPLPLPATATPPPCRCSWAGDGLCDDTVHPESINLVCSFGSDCADCGARDTFWLPHWAAITISLLLTALVDGWG